jgi:subtilisin family serine protease
MSDEPIRPAWSQQFAADAIRELVATGPFVDITREWAWGGSTGKGVRVAVVDTGIEYDHPWLEGCVRSGVVVGYNADLEVPFYFEDENPPIDVAGHGTACAGIIHKLAPEAELYSVRVLGKNMKGRAWQFAGGLDWAIDNGMQVINLSLSTSREEYHAVFRELTDAAYYKNVILVSAINNLPAPSYPSLYSAVVSVAAHDGHDPFVYYYNPEPPVEFGAPGIDVEVAWNEKMTMVTTGNSFAAPHIAGIVSLIRAKHPELTPFQIKSVLYACASNRRQE